MTVGEPTSHTFSRLVDYYLGLTTALQARLGTLGLGCTWLQLFLVSAGGWQFPAGPDAYSFTLAAPQHVVSLASSSVAAPGRWTPLRTRQKRGARVACFRKMRLRIPTEAVSFCRRASVCFLRGRFGQGGGAGWASKEGRRIGQPFELATARHRRDHHLQSKRVAAGGGGGSMLL